MSKLVQLYLTDEQAGLLGIAVDTTIRSSADEEHGLISLTEEELADMQRLQVFMFTLASSPEKFPVRGQMAKSIKKAARQIKGDAQPQSRKNKRKARQERRMSVHKRRRKERRVFAEAFNEAREQYEADLKEMQEVQEQRQREIEAEAKFDVTDIMGNVIIGGVPQSMIRPAVSDDPAQTPGDTSQLGAEVPKVILPGSAEALGVELTE